MKPRKVHLTSKIKPSTKPMRQYRKKRRPGNSKMTVAEASLVERAKVGPCMACIRRYLDGHMRIHRIVIGCDWNHAKSGNVRIGHAAGFACCGWHHRRIPWDGTSFAEMTETYGPSLMDGSRLFHATYGSDAELIALQLRVLELHALTADAVEGLR